MNSVQQVKRMIGGIGNVLFSTNSQTLNWQDQVATFGGPLVHVRTLFFFSFLSLPPLPHPSRVFSISHLRVSIQNVPVCTREVLFLRRSHFVMCETPLDPSFTLQKPSCDPSCKTILAGGWRDRRRVNSIWPTESQLERAMLHQVGHPPQNASDIAKQIVGLPGHSVSPHWTALVLNVSPSTARF